MGALANVDLVCINQDDINERSQQVSLMAEIYQRTAAVLMWIGQGTPRTQQAFHVIQDVAELSDSFDSKSLEAFSLFKSPSDIPAGKALERLRRDPS